LRQVGKHLDSLNLPKGATDLGTGSGWTQLQRFFEVQGANVLKVFNIDNSPKSK
jgi:hypothetical protein